MSACQVAALFVRADSIYKTMPEVDCWDIDRDARNWPGGCPVVAHPPCRAWGKLQHFARPRDDEKELAVWAVGQVRKFGGWTLPIDQNWFGHRAKKATRLYVVGCGPLDVPPLPLVLGEASHVVGLWSGRDRARCRKSIGKSEREHTPVDLARWLVALASRCKP